MAAPALTVYHVEKLDLIFKFRTSGNAAGESVYLASQQCPCSKESVLLERVTRGEEGIVEQLQCKLTTKLLEFVHVFNIHANLSNYLYILVAETKNQFIWIGIWKILSKADLSNTELHKTQRSTYYFSGGFRVFVEDGKLTLKLNKS